MYYKINNLLQNNGHCDYKGLDIDKIISGSQFYDFKNNMCVLESTEVVSFNDLVQITTEEYTSIKEQIIANLPAPPPTMEELQSRINLMQMALDDLILGGAL